ncbi:hypothetical protein NPS01_09210 [Nocardioides psychrotolerans]|uniref:Uncharacterized protein n=1 Tax=Nocardioides psychrotolerans TaxID=1005945 RepID=A0A1I3FRB5_9ACTN|nr:hypothetical protein NPS01_09210 [Nocardioides psychrotolerans]SFI13461.1 hypothetical protein SAMN05216561_105101 [Nocardioides psychrotolerans]
MAPHRYEPQLFGGHDDYSVGEYFTTIDPDTMQCLHATSF